MINDYYILAVFILVSIICYYLFYRLAKEQKILINLYAKKFGTTSHDELREKMLKNPIAAPYYAMRKTFSMLSIIFKKTNNPEINTHSQRVRRYFYFIIFSIIALFTFLIIYSLLSIK